MRRVDSLWVLLEGISYKSLKYLYAISYSLTEETEKG